MSNLAFVEYCFLIDPDGMYLSLTQFEKDIADFFAAHGKQVEVVETLGIGRKILLVKKLEVEPTPTPQQKLPPLNLKEPQNPKLKTVSQTLDKFRK